MICVYTTIGSIVWMESNAMSAFNLNLKEIKKLKNVIK